MITKTNDVTKATPDKQQQLQAQAIENENVTKINSDLNIESLELKPVLEETEVPVAVVDQPEESLAVTSSDLKTS